MFSNFELQRTSTYLFYSLIFINLITDDNVEEYHYTHTSYENITLINKTLKESNKLFTLCISIESYNNFI